MTIKLVGAAKLGKVRVTGSTLADLISQAPDLEELHYLVIEAKVDVNPQPDSVRIVFGSPEGLSRLQAFRGWFRRVKEWDVRITAQSGSAQEADRILASALSALRGHRITTTHVWAFSSIPQFSEIIGLAFFVALILSKTDSADVGYFFALVGIFYWRLVFFVRPNGAHIYLRARSTYMGRILGWSPSPRVQAIWAVIGSFAGIAALIVSVFAWISPQN
ncbi:hypothetical protein [Streptomyces liliifuscus]|uniref:Uncharacterized protein n=1 Tax=Streptomyces liliifuscus TaxID=2797636 RepID=A0A7T7I6N4_9ACTN|nr:hypothetical protein [Streptomyces liliifuscus]QQM42010.1 hypothetical protein JEQ17_22910 [Streptomyces liliifuscus]